MNLPRGALLFTLLVLPGVAFAAPPPDHDRAVKPIQKFATREDFSKYLRAKGYKARGGIEKSKTDRDDPKVRSFPHFSSSFAVGGTTYPYTMVGYPPSSGRTAKFKSVIVPLRMNFIFFGQNGDVNITFEPGQAVQNIVNSPLYNEASFANGRGQFGDQMQRATFWNGMDRQHNWHVLMDQPRVARTVDIEVTPETGALFQIGSDPKNIFGDVLIDFMDAEILTILQFAGVGPDELPIFVTDNVTAEALGYHSATVAAGDDDSEVLQTYIFTSWLDPAKVNPLFADVSTFNHELLEWMNDPYVNNIVPTWRYPPESDPRATCSDNPFLEVGDPQGNGPTFNDFPTIVVRTHGTDYHLQQLVLLQWFTDERPSSAFGGWYTFPDPTSLKDPAVYCK
jgi:hypothetical protein